MLWVFIEYHNICFRGEIRKILCGYPLLSVAMYVQFDLGWIVYLHLDAQRRISCREPIKLQT